QLRLLPIDLRSRASSPRRRTHGVNLSCPHQPALPHTPGTQVHTLSPGNHGTTAPGETPTVVNADTADTKLSPCGAVQSATYHLTAPQYWRPMTLYIGVGRRATHPAASDQAMAHLRNTSANCSLAVPHAHSIRTRFR